MKQFIKSVGFAFSGFAVMLRKERNFKIQLCCLVFLLFSLIFFHCSAMESIVLLLSAGFVLVAEVLNSALEKICDLISLEIHPKIKIIKDISAAAPLIASIIALVNACIVFVPKVINLLSCD